MADAILEQSSDEIVRQTIRDLGVPDGSYENLYDGLNMAIGNLVDYLNAQPAQEASPIPFDGQYTPDLGKLLYAQTVKVQADDKYKNIESLFDGVETGSFEYKGTMLAYKALLPEGIPDFIKNNPKGFIRLIENDRMIIDAMNDLYKAEASQNAEASAQKDAAEKAQQREEQEAVLQERLSALDDNGAAENMAGVLGQEAGQALDYNLLKGRVTHIQERAGWSNPDGFYSDEFAAHLENLPVLSQDIELLRFHNAMKSLKGSGAYTEEIALGQAEPPTPAPLEKPVVDNGPAPVPKPPEATGEQSDDVGTASELSEQTAFLNFVMAQIINGEDGTSGLNQELPDGFVKIKVPDEARWDQFGAESQATYTQLVQAMRLRYPDVEYSNQNPKQYFETLIGAMESDTRLTAGQRASLQDQMNNLQAPILDAVGALNDAGQLPDVPAGIRPEWAASIMNQAMVTIISGDAEKGITGIDDQLPENFAPMGLPASGDTDFGAASQATYTQLVQAMQLRYPDLQMADQANPSAYFDAVLDRVVADGVASESDLAEMREPLMMAIETLETQDKLPDVSQGTRPEWASAIVEEMMIEIAGVINAQTVLGIGGVDKLDQADGNFGTESTQNFQQILDKLSRHKGIEFDPDNPRGFVDALMNEMSDEQKAAVATKLEPAGGVNGLVVALDTLHRQGKIDALDPSLLGGSDFQLPGFLQEALAWVVNLISGAFPGAMPMMDELARDFTGGKGLNDLLGKGNDLPDMRSDYNPNLSEEVRLQNLYTRAFNDADNVYEMHAAMRSGVRVISAIPLGDERRRLYNEAFNEGLDAAETVLAQATEGLEKGSDAYNTAMAGAVKGASEVFASTFIERKNGLPAPERDPNPAKMLDESIVGIQFAGSDMNVNHVIEGYYMLNGIHHPDFDSTVDADATQRPEDIHRPFVFRDADGQVYIAGYDDQSHLSSAERNASNLFTIQEIDLKKLQEIAATYQLSEGGSVLQTEANKALIEELKMNSMGYAMAMESYGTYNSPVAFLEEAANAPMIDDLYDHLQARSAMRQADAEHASHYGGSGVNGLGPGTPPAEPFDRFPGRAPTTAELIDMRHDVDDRLLEQSQARSAPVITHDEESGRIYATYFDRQLYLEMDPEDRQQVFRSADITDEVRRYRENMDLKQIGRQNAGESPEAYREYYEETSLALSQNFPICTEIAKSYGHLKNGFSVVEYAAREAGMERPKPLGERPTHDDRLQKESLSDRFRREHDAKYGDTPRHVRHNKHEDGAPERTAARHRYDRGSDPDVDVPSREHAFQLNASDLSGQQGHDDIGRKHDTGMDHNQSGIHFRH